MVVQTDTQTTTTPCHNDPLTCPPSFRMCVYVIPFLHDKGLQTSPSPILPFLLITLSLPPSRPLFILLFQYSLILPSASSCSLSSFLPQLTSFHLDLPITGAPQRPDLCPNLRQHHTYIPKEARHTHSYLLTHSLSLFVLRVAYKMDQCVLTLLVSGNAHVASIISHASMCCY